MIGSDSLELKGPSNLARSLSIRPQIHITHLKSPDCVQLFFTCRPDPRSGSDLASQLRSLYRGIFTCLEAEGARPVEVVAEKLFFRDVTAGVGGLPALRSSSEFPWDQYTPASIALEEPP